VTFAIRAIDLDDPADVELGRELVEEYALFTADENRQLGINDVDLPLLRRILPDLRDFAGRYRGGAYLVATVDGAVAGGVGIAESGGGTCEMNRLWLRDGHRGRGAGRALVDACLEHARGLGFTRMVLDVVPYRTGAIALYRAFGFADIDPIHEYPFAMVAMGRDL
jgi:GNAT superfamily N-acetyltransferase